MGESRFDRVARVLEVEFAKPYVPGKSDCFFTFIRLADELAPDLGLEEAYAGAYRTLAGAQRALRRRGHASLVDLFATHMERCGAAQARVGDIGVILLADGEHVGACVGAQFVTKTARGQSFHEFADVIAAFRAG
jgi:hypothetical protein